MCHNFCINRPAQRTPFEALLPPPCLPIPSATTSTGSLLFNNSFFCTRCAVVRGRRTAPKQPRVHQTTSKGFSSTGVSTQAAARAACTPQCFLATRFAASALPTPVFLVLVIAAVCGTAQALAADGSVCSVAGDCASGFCLGGHCCTSLAPPGPCLSTPGRTIGPVWTLFTLTYMRVSGFAWAGLC